MQLNKDIQRTDLPTKEIINTDLQSTHSIPILSPNPSPLEQEAAAPPERKRKEAEAQTAFEIYREIIKDISLSSMVSLLYVLRFGSGAAVDRFFD